MHWTIKSNKGQKLLSKSRKTLCTELSRNILNHRIKLFFEFQLVVLKLCSGQKESNGNVTKGSNSITTSGQSYGYCALHFLLLCLTIVWSCFEFQPVLFKLCCGHGIVSKGNNSVICQNYVIVFVTALPLNVLEDCMKLYWIPTITLQVMTLQVMVRTKESNGKETKGNNSVITSDIVMVLEHCTFSYCAWPLYKVVLNFNQ
jgi:hypothetical protein